MKKRNLGRLAVLATASAAVLIGSALPASATVHNYNVDYKSGTITVGSEEFHTPGTEVGDCEGGGTSITGTVNDAGGTDTIGGTLNISAPFDAGFLGTYILTVSGTSAGTDQGNYSGGATGTFTNMEFPDTDFSIRSFDPETCTPGSQVCGDEGSPSSADGQLDLTVSGGIAPGSNLGLGSGEEIYVSAAGEFTNAGCTFFHPLNLIIFTGNTITLGDNSNDCYLDPGTPAPPPRPALQTCGTGSSPDPGAIFEQV